MEGGALSTEDFKKWSEKYVMFCHITTQVESDKDQNLLSEKGGRGFPHLVFMDASGDVIAQHQGARSTEAFEKTGSVAVDFIALKKRVADGDKTAVNPYFIARLELGQFGFAEAKAEAAKLEGLSEEQQATIDGLMLDLEIMDALESLRGPEGMAKMAELGKDWYERAKKGVAPSGQMAGQMFYSLILQYGQMESDPDAFEVGINGIEKMFGDNPQMKPQLDQMRQVLAEMRKAKASEGGDG